MNTPAAILFTALLVQAAVGSPVQGLVPLEVKIQFCPVDPSETLVDSVSAFRPADNSCDDHEFHPVEGEPVTQVCRDFKSDSDITAVVNNAIVSTLNAANTHGDPFVAQYYNAKIDGKAVWQNTFAYRLDTCVAYAARPDGQPAFVKFQENMLGNYMGLLYSDGDCTDVTGSVPAESGYLSHKLFKFDAETAKYVPSADYLTIQSVAKTEQSYLVAVQYGDGQLTANGELPETGTEPLNFMQVMVGSEETCDDNGRVKSPAHGLVYKTCLSAKQPDDAMMVPLNGAKDQNLNDFYVAQYFYSDVDRTKWQQTAVYSLDKCHPYNTQGYLKFVLNQADEYSVVGSAYVDDECAKQPRYLTANDLIGYKLLDCTVPGENKCTSKPISMAPPS